MKISHWQFFKYFYFSLLILWFIVTLHIVYLYIDYTSIKTPVKGWTFVEATTEKVSYLPYISTKNNDKFYQSFLFNWCLTPYVTWTDIIYKEDLCSVKTTDYKTFDIKILTWHYWSDWEPITLNDINFTYELLLIKNIWNLQTLDNYQNITINFTWDNMQVIFPYPSIDNQIFFTNFILPLHWLEWESVEDYITKFWTEPITSGCAKLDNNQNDTNSVVFNLSACDKAYIKYYQIKQFKDFNEFEKYIKNAKTQIIDLITSPAKIEWFVDNTIILNKFITLFFNTSQNWMNLEVRKAIADIITHNIYTGDYENYFVKDNFIFDANIKWNKIKEVLAKAQEEVNKPTPREKNFPDLPETIKIYSWQIYYDFFKDTIKWEQKIYIDMQKSFDKVSVNDNWNEYFLSDYKKWDKLLLYKVAEDYKNIKQWENKYIVKWYSWNQAIEYLKFNIHYKVKPIEIPVALTWDQKQTLKIQIIYFWDKTNKYITDRLNKIFQKYEVSDYFEFQEFLVAEEFEWKVQSKEYDIALKWIDMWLKKDISNIFGTDEAVINPSLYKNTDLSSIIKQYFINEWKVKDQVKNELDSLYEKSVPLIVLWKRYWSVNIREDLLFAFPVRLYDYRFKKDSLKDIKLSYSLSIDMAKVFSFKNIKNFFSDYLNNNK